LLLYVNVHYTVRYGGNGLCGVCSVSSLHSDSIGKISLFHPKNEQSRKQIV